MIISYFEGNIIPKRQPYKLGLFKNRTRNTKISRGEAKKLNVEDLSSNKFAGAMSISI